MTLVPTDPEQFAALMGELRAMAASAVTENEARALTVRIAKITRAYRVANRIGIPAGLAEQAVELDAGYRVRPHLQYLSDRIAAAVKDVEQGRNRMIAVSMPPRSGKSTLLSRYGPLWLLRHHPEWSIVTASHDGGLAAGWAAGDRQVIEGTPSLGIALARDGGAGSHWSTVEGGGLFSVSVRGALIGRGARVMIIDDPVANFVEAHSAVARQSLWDWWLSVAYTRLEAPYLVLVIMCMTGDTPVLRPDGTETPLRDIRPGDEIATYENGQLTTSRVLNWTPQGRDKVFEIRMKSGASVQANARHPFLTVENGRETWQRTDSLRPGSRILQVTGGSTRESSAPSRSARSQPEPEACACRTTTRPDGPRVIDLHQRIPFPAEQLISRIGTASPLRNMTGSSLIVMERATSAETVPSRILAGTAGWSSTTIIEPAICAACSARRATSSSRRASLPSGFDLRRSTWPVTLDEVLEVIPAGEADVYDIEVERTHNFVANGLITLNTRWHEEDFVGRLFSPDYEGSPADWERISLPAIADREDDALGRAPGEPLYSPLLNEDRNAALDRWFDIKRAVGTYLWSAMYQQSPAPAKGAIFDTGWWRFWTTNRANATSDGRVVYLDPSSLTGGQWTDSWDTNFDSTETSLGSWVVGQRWVKQGANRYLIAQQRGRWTFTQTLARMEDWAVTDNPHLSLCGHLVHERLIEKKANGAAIIDVLKEKISGLKPINPTASKEARARAVTPECESGNVYIPYPGDPGNEWVADWLSEVRNFPHDAADDQVDAMTQALSRLRNRGAGLVSVPGRMGATWQLPRNVAAAALTDLGRPRDRGQGPRR